MKTSYDPNNTTSYIKRGARLKSSDNKLLKVQLTSSLYWIQWLTTLTFLWIALTEAL
ncbi:hypothetical protein [Marinoscillum furvescens]|nr:hypothetical protein [Marinoscillum furvescens]